MGDRAASVVHRHSCPPWRDWSSAWTERLGEPGGCVRARLATDYPISRPRIKAPFLGPDLIFFMIPGQTGYLAAVSRQSRSRELRAETAPSMVLVACAQTIASLLCTSFSREVRPSPDRPVRRAASAACPAVQGL